MNRNVSKTVSCAGAHSAEVLNLQAARGEADTAVVDAQPRVGAADGKEVRLLRRGADGVELDGAEAVPGAHICKHTVARPRSRPPVYLAHYEAENWIC